MYYNNYTHLLIVDVDGSVIFSDKVAKIILYKKNSSKLYVLVAKCVKNVFFRFVLSYASPSENCKEIGIMVKDKLKHIFKAILVNSELKTDNF